LNEEVILLDDFAGLLNAFASLLLTYPLKNHQNELKQSIEVWCYTHCTLLLFARCLFCWSSTEKRARWLCQSLYKVFRSAL